MAKKRRVKGGIKKGKTGIKKSAKRPKAKSVGPRRPVSKKKKTAAKKAPKSTLEKIGEVTHYFPHVKAAAVMILKDGLRVGDEVYIKGHTTDFKEKVNSIQMDHVSVQECAKGQEIGLLVKSRVRIGDSVYRI